MIRIVNGSHPDGLPIWNEIPKADVPFLAWVMTHLIVPRQNHKRLGGFCPT
ncbi:hypothetical protein [Parasedimentitalea huanghaiensis]|uniref:Uncharacterized protein n=1 Tax=Parasedimentitalea huanghaiensis TaxID=2682100 RepID=A0A6L6WDJ8_9RHOB|nr:hypothetical protein [Zongyanglinia huanghaiensis]MVO15358.1 hypothetical protein [Zongyanglinia huanghaiensis]